MDGIRALTIELLPMIEEGGWRMPFDEQFEPQPQLLVQPLLHSWQMHGVH